MLPPPFLEMDPDDDIGWLAVADWLEEHGQSDRAELVRLTRLLRLDPTRVDVPGRDNKRMELLAAGVEPCVATVRNSIGMTLAWIPPGTFSMGSPEGEAARSVNEGPEHDVTITEGFYLGIYQVTQGEYEQIMGSNPSYFAAMGTRKDEVKDLKTDRFPVENVSHHDAVEFCEKLSARAREEAKQRVYRLPTEAEWEYACRGGANLKTPFHFGTFLSSGHANFDGSKPYGVSATGPYLRRTCDVGSYLPNGYGLYDTHGNVWEWCSDWYEEHYSFEGNEVNPSGPAEGLFRVLRGGHWGGDGRSCRSAHRIRFDPSSRYATFGFRVALIPIR